MEIFREFPHGKAQIVKLENSVDFPITVLPLLIPDPISIIPVEVIGLRSKTEINLSFRKK